MNLHEWFQTPNYCLHLYEYWLLLDEERIQEAVVPTCSSHHFPNPVVPPSWHEDQLVEVGVLDPSTEKQVLWLRTSSTLFWQVHLAGDAM